MRAIYLIILGILLLNSCTKTPPGQTIQLEDASDITINRITSQAQTIESPFSFTVPKGRALVLSVGNPHKEMIKLNTGDASIELAPQSWTNIDYVAENTQLKLIWSGESLYFARPYVRPQITEPKQFLLISIDTLRADHFTAETMPNLYKLFAEQGEIIQGMRTPTPWTLPAHASLFTGLYPASHGLRLPNQKLPQEALTIAEIFQENGYRTMAVTEGNYLAPSFALNQGFGAYFENAPQMMSHDLAAISKLEPNINVLEEMVSSVGSDPAFVFFHTYEVHCPFVPRFGLEDPQGLGSTQWLLDHDGQALSDKQLTLIKDLYRNEVVYTDQVMAPVISKLLEQGWIIALTSDHGEELGEHGGLLHADNLYEESTAVPFAIAGHGKKGVRQMASSLIDIAPSLLHLANLTIPENWPGVNILAEQSEKSIFSESFFMGPQHPAENPRVVGVWQQDDKLIQSRNFDAYSAELFDLKQDPGEQNNLQDKQVEKRDRLYRLIEIYLSGKQLNSEQVGELTEEQLETMRSLGYIK